MIKLLSLFTGIGAFEKALERLNAEYELVGFSEIDKYAIKSYCAIHNVTEDKNYGDISKIDEKSLPDFDIMTWGFPCQDISIAGKLKGIKEGETRSGLYYEGYRILKNKKPKISIIENVKNLTSKRFKNEFESILKDISDLGYNNYWQVLNAKDYGIPQNRERVYTVSIRKDIDNKTFKFPETEELKLRLKDMLENKVEDKYYLKENQIENFIKNNNGNCNPSGKGMNGKVHTGNIAPTITTNKGEGPKIQIEGMLDIKGQDNIKRVYSQEGISPTLTDMQGGNRQPKILIKNATKKGYVEAVEGDSINLAYPNSETRRWRVGHQVSQTLTVNNSIAVLDSQTRIRKLTPKECWRLMRI